MEHSIHRGSPFSPFLDWKAAISAGLITGLVFMMAWLFMGQSPWGPLRSMAAMLLGRGVPPPPAEFALMPMMVAMMIHFPLSVIYGVILGWIVHRFDMSQALLIGLLFGLVAVYVVNFYLVAPVLFPWFTKARNWVSVVAHALFGLVTAAVYVARRERYA